MADNRKEYESALAEGLHKDAMSGFERFLKRLFDIVVSFVGLILLSPVYLVFWLILAFQDGPVIYRQERIGYKGRPFTILKFRSMKTDAETAGIPRLEEERNQHMTKTGVFMRAHHLDELPQLWNVFKGDMSFVGPRPERQYFIDQINKETSEYKYIYMMRPGVTSHATLYNGYTDTMEKMLTRLRLDLEYLDKRSLGLDFSIIFKTVWSIVSGKKF